MLELKANNALVMVIVGITLTSLSAILALIELYGMYQFVSSLVNQLCTLGGTCYSLVSPIILLAPIVVFSLCGAILTVIGTLRLRDRVAQEAATHIP